MVELIVRRIILGLVALIGAMLILFFLSRATGDPRYAYIGLEGVGIDPEVWERMGEKLHLDDPVPVQFGYWVVDIVRGDFGESVALQRPVIQIIQERIGATVKLGIAAWLLGMIIGVPLGVFSATHRGRFLDYLFRGFALLGQSLPIFWIGIVLIFVFAANLQWLPAGTKGEGFLSIKHLVLPTLTLAWYPAASYLRITRTAMLEVMDSEYVKLARAKGVGRYTVWWKHAFRNAIIPPLTLSVFVLFGLMNGTVIVETVFSWPGLGRLAIQALQATDFPLLAGITIIYGGLFLIGILLLDIMYVFLDPRIKYK
jgi:peptide/nickel transport system permease protein